MFTNIFGNRHIYLNGGDVVIPVDFNWNLTAPTDVVASNTPDNEVEDYAYGTDHKINLVVEGGLNTTSSIPGTYSVVFRPEVVTGLAEDWGGVHHRSGRGNVLQHADFGHAKYPLFMYYPDSLATVRRCSFHDFAEVGLWIQGTFGQGAIVDSNFVYRGDDLPQHLGRIGVFLDRTDALTFSDNLIWMETNNEGHPTTAYSRAVEALFGKTMCLAPGGNPKTLSIHYNTLVGPGHNKEPVPAGGTSGVYANWVCGGGNRTVEFTKNWIGQFNFSGLEFSESSDIQVSCNKVFDSRRAVEFRRTSEPAGPGVRFRENYFDVPAGYDGLVRSDNALKTKLGPALVNKGRNELRTTDQGGTLTKFILEDEPGNAHVEMNAANNSWFKNGSQLLSESVIDIPDLIWTLLPNTEDPDTTDRPLVNVVPPNGISWGDDCWERTSSRIAGGEPPAIPSSAVPSERAGLPSLLDRLPAVTRISAPYPNPARRSSHIALEISPDRAGRYRVEVFDVLGRSVAVLVDGHVQAGRYQVEWAGQSNRGSPVVRGVYFIRVTGPGVKHNAKLVLLP